MNISSNYQGPFGLDRLAKPIKLLNWIICFLLTTIGIGLTSFNILIVSLDRSILGFVAVFSPAYLTIAWLRLTGVRWRYGFLLLILSPIVVILGFYVTIWVIFNMNID